jgi:biopolymer transport protein ExbD
MTEGSRGDPYDAITGINVTPPVDITLVLLIIFMVTARVVVSQSMTLDLPKTAPIMPGTQKILSIAMAANGRVQVDSKPVPSEDAILLIAREAHAKNTDVRAVIEADSMVTHGHVVHVLDLLRQADVTKIAFGVHPTAPPHER